MNERIKELAGQAKFMAEETINKQISKNAELDAFAEKFAELIVQECTSSLMTPKYIMNHPEELSEFNRGWVNGRLSGIEDIKEHFGIE